MTMPISDETNAEQIIEGAPTLEEPAVVGSSHTAKQRA
jgi:hypothetical protein